MLLKKNKIKTMGKGGNQKRKLELEKEEHKQNPKSAEGRKS